MRKSALIKRNETYMLEKLVYYIMFSQDKEEYKEYNDWIDEGNFLISLRNIVETHTSQNELNATIRDNIYSFLQYIRFDYGKLSKENMEIVNDIIRLLNNQKKDESYIFYCMELRKRTCELKHLFNPYESLKYADIIDNSICMDFVLITSQNEDCTTDEEFEEIYIPIFTKNNDYYYSLNAILHDNPLLFQDKVFYTRTLKVLKELAISNNNKEILETNEKFIKEINRKIKKYK